MKCSICKEEHDISKFYSFRVYQDNYIVKKLDLCNICNDKLLKNGKLDKLTDKLIEEGYNLYEISRCSNYNNCEKIDNLRKMCENVENVNQSSIFDYSKMVKGMNWCNPANAGIISASVKLYELLENYEKSSTKLSNDMLSYTKNMHHLTWILLAFAIVGFILTFINAYIAYLQLVKI